jgi:hypothetical protein
MKIHHRFINTTKIITELYLGEISNHMTSPVITFTEYIKQEQVDIVIQGFVIKKEFGQITKVLSINLILLPINLPLCKHTSCY